MPPAAVDADLANPFEAEVGEELVDEDTVDDDTLDADAEGVSSANDSEPIEPQPDDDLQSAEIIPLRASGAEPGESE